MTSQKELTFDEVAAHGVAIATAKTEEEFILAFSAYARDVVERETEPYQKIALFVHSMLEGHRTVLETLVRHLGGATA